MRRGFALIDVIIAGVILAIGAEILPNLAASPKAREIYLGDRFRL